MSSYATQPTSQYSGVQPKFKDCVFDSSKEPAAFRVWLRLISGLVMSIAHGVWLETFLDNFLGRNPFQSSTRPAFLNDPALALDDSPQGNNTFPSPMPPTSESGGNSPLPSFDRATTQSRDGTEAINPKQYRDLPEEAMSLDKALFNIIANKYVMFLATMPVEKIDLNPTLNVEVQDEHEVSRDRPKAKIWWENHKAQTNANMADIQTKQMAYFAGHSAPKAAMTQAQLSNLVMGLVPRTRK